MYQLRIDLPAIRAAARHLKRNYPRKRGVIVRISASVESGFGSREHHGYASWDGTKRSLASAQAALVGSYAAYRKPAITLCLTHRAIAASDPVAEAAKADITRFILQPID